MHAAQRVAFAGVVGYVVVLQLRRVRNLSGAKSGSVYNLLCFEPQVGAGQLQADSPQQDWVRCSALLIYAVGHSPATCHL
jgi:hypothetical protein